MSNTPGLLAVSLYKPSDGTTYQLDGKDIAPDSEGYNNSGNFVGQTRGGEREKNRTVTFDVRHADSTFHSNLTGDTDFENRSWRMVAAEMDGFVLWYETVRVVIPETKGEIDPESDDPYPYSFRLRFVGASPNIGRGTNLLYAYAKANGRASAWKDSDSDNLADGYSLTGATATDFTDTVQTISFSDGVDFTLNKSIVFPISGIKITFSGLQSKGSGFVSAEIEVRNRNFAGSSLQTVDDIYNSTTVRESIDVTTSSNGYTLFFELIKGTPSGGSSTLEIQNPSARLNGSTNYIDG